MYTLVSNRFTQDTWNENQEYKIRHALDGCIYGSPQRLSPKIQINALLHVIEMNNSTNKILGIGIIRNMVQYDKYYQVYKTGNYNRYIFKGKYHLDRDDLPANVIEALDYILFKEKTHMKRGAGMTTVPEKLLRHPKVGEIDIRKEIKDAFLRKYKDNDYEKI
jgi:hypothetical protein